MMGFTVGDAGYFSYFREKARREGYALPENERNRVDVVSYLSEKGKIDGVWIGGQAAVFGLSGVATQKEAARLFELGQHPTTGQMLGKKIAEFVSLDDRVDTEMNRLSLSGELLGLDKPAYDQRRAEVRRELQRTNQDRAAATCVEFTAAATKSSSALYGMYLVMGDQQRADLVLQALQNANRATRRKWEKEFLKSRLGGLGKEVMAQVDVEGGAIGVSYLHETARPALGLPAMPHLHIHNLYSTRVQVFDPKTNEMKFLQMDTATARDSRQVLSGYFDLAFEQELTALLGVRFVTPEHELHLAAGERNREIAGLDNEQLLAAWSARAEQIAAEAKRLLEAFVDRTGRQPTQSEELAMNQQANLTTREAKNSNREDELHSWAAVAEHTMGSDWQNKVRALTQNGPQRHVGSAFISTAQHRDLAAQVVAEIESTGKTTWTHNQLQARVIKVLKGTYGADLSPADSDALEASVLAIAASEMSVTCTGYEQIEGEIDSTLNRRKDGSSVFRRHGETLYTSDSILKKEADMLDWARDVKPGRRISLASFEAAVAYWEKEDGHPMAPDQYAAALHLVSSGRSIDTLVGGPGTGKTTTLKVVVKAAQLEGRKVIGLTLAQSAANVMKEGAALDASYNYADFRTRIDNKLLKWEKGARYLVDESSAVSLQDLHSLAENARAHGATVTLVGDHRQHGTVSGAGGTLRLIHEQEPGPELTSVWRFWTTDEAGKKVVDTDYANLVVSVRDLDPAAAKGLMDRGIVQFGTKEQMEKQAIAAWEDALRRGQHAVLPVRSNEQRAELSRLGVEAMRAGGHLGASTGWTLRDGTDVYVGSYVMARLTTGDQRYDLSEAELAAAEAAAPKNADGTLRYPPSRSNGNRGEKVANRDALKVIGYNPLTGDLKVKSQRHGKTLTLPRSYWSTEMESSIAVTGSTVQGLTCDADFSIVNSSSTNADLLVAISRGTKEHGIFVVTDDITADGEQAARFDSPEQVLASIIRRDASEKAASQVIEDDWQMARNLRTLSGRHRYYSDIAALAARDQAEKAVRAAMGTTEAEQVLAAEAWPTLATRIAELQLDGVDVTAALMDTLAERSIGDAADPAAILSYRLETAPAAVRPSTRALDAASVVVPWLRSPELPVDVSSDALEAMRSYELASVQRATYLADQALRDSASWLAQLGPAPAGGELRQQYLATVAAASAYREQFRVDDANAAVGQLVEEAPAQQQRAHAHVTALVEDYQKQQTAVLVADPVLVAVAAREAAFPAQAFTPTDPSAVPDYPATSAAPAAWYERTWGKVSDENLAAQQNRAARELPQLESRLPRLEGDLVAAQASYDAAAATATAGQGKAVTALHTHRDRLARQEQEQAAVLAARQRQVELRTAAEAAEQRAEEQRALSSGLFARHKAAAAAEAQKAAAEHQRLLVELRTAQEELAELQRVAGPDVTWPKVRAERDALTANWETQLEIAHAADASPVRMRKADVERITEVLDQTRQMVAQTQSVARQLRDEVALRAAQDPEQLAQEAGQRALLARIEAKKAEQAAAAQPTKPADVAGPRREVDGPDRGTEVTRG